MGQSILVSPKSYSMFEKLCILYGQKCPCMRIFQNLNITFQAVGGGRPFKLLEKKKKRTMSFKISEKENLIY